MREKITLQWAEVEVLLFFHVKTYKIGDREKMKELMEDYVKDYGKIHAKWFNYIRLLRHFSNSTK
jgi:hypothetical protein